MDKLVIPNGGMFLEGDDFRFMYTGLEAALKGSLWPFVATHNGNAILAGCEISFSGGSASITEGWVVIGGEICYCAAQTVPVGSLAGSSLKVVETYDAAGLEVFADAVSRDTYALRRAVISDGLNSGNEIVLDTPARVYYQKSFQTSDLAGNWELNTNALNESSLVATMFNGVVFWNGRIGNESSQVNILSDLPVLLQPQKSCTFVGPSNTELVKVTFFGKDTVQAGLVIASSVEGTSIDLTGKSLGFNGFSYIV